MKPLVILAGPTAVGKTALSIKLAKKINGAVISADSMQVYKHMDIGSAKVMPEEMKGIPHYLIDVLEPSEEFNIVRFQQMAKDAMDKIYDKGRIPILVGGTGFYIQSVTRDIDFTSSDQDEHYRRELEELAQASAYAEDICLMGFSGNPYPWMARADAFVLSSDSEGLPTVLIEAIACGAPVISTDCPHGPREILQDGAYGMLVPVNDAQRMAQAIAHTLRQPAQKQSVQPLLEKFQQQRAFQAYQRLLD